MLKLSEITIYRAEQSLFITQNDHNLIEITGDDVMFLEEIINNIQEGYTIETITDKLYDKFQIEENYTFQLIDWLVDNGIAKQQQSKELLQKMVYIFAPTLTEEQKKQVCEALSDQDMNIFLTDSIETANVILFISPMLDSLGEFEAINRAAYEAGIISLHFGSDLQTFTLGPLCIPFQQTPCLHCYFKRKLINMRNLNQTLRFIQYPNRHVIQKNSLVNTSTFQLGLNYVKYELSRVLHKDYIRSTLAACSVVYDTVRHETQASRILKMPFCPVCSKRTPFYAPFNA